MLNRKNLLLSVCLILTGCFGNGEEPTISHENLLSKTILSKERALSASGLLPTNYVTTYRKTHIKKLGEADNFFKNNLAKAKKEHTQKVTELDRFILDLKASSKGATGDQKLKAIQEMKAANLKKSKMIISYRDKTKILAENRKNRLNFLNNSYLDVLTQDFDSKD